MLTNARSPIILNRTKKETPNKSRRSHLVYNHTQLVTQLSNAEMGNPESKIQNLESESGIRE